MGGGGGLFQLLLYLNMKEGEVGQCMPTTDVLSVDNVQQTIGVAIVETHSLQNTRTGSERSSVSNIDFRLFNSHVAYYYVAITCGNKY